MFARVLDDQTSTSLSTLVLPIHAQSSLDGTYFRLESYSLILVDAKDGANLTTVYFNFQQDLKYLVMLHEANFDLNQLFAMEVKVFYNLAMDFWRMIISPEELWNKYKNQGQWKLKHGELQRTRIPLHIDSHRLFLIMQIPKIVYVNNDTHYNEKLEELSINDLKMLQTQYPVCMEEFCYHRLNHSLQKL